MAPLLFIGASPIAWRRSTSVPLSARRLTVTACEASIAAPSKEELDKLFSRLNHVNQNLRKKASAAIAELGGEENINRLADLLDLEDTGHRRAAVQALGMTGVSIIPRVVDLLKNSPNSTVRASCSKALAAVALYFPEERENFPAEALEALAAALEQDPDPVTKLATVGCLGTLGSDIRAKGKGEESWALGSERAVEILVTLCGKTQDMAVGATAIGAVAQIGQNGSPERKAAMAGHLRALCESDEHEDESESGFNYIREMARSNLEQLEEGTRVPDE